MSLEQSKGFLLIEAIPALLLLVGVLIAVMNLQRIRMRLNDFTSRNLAAASAFDGVSILWQRNPDSQAAASTWSDNIGWELTDLPDEDWLPLDSYASGQTALWRRTPTVDESGNESWRIELYHPSAKKWRWWSDTLRQNVQEIE